MWTMDKEQAKHQQQQQKKKREPEGVILISSSFLFLFFLQPYFRPLQRLRSFSLFLLCFTHPYRNYSPYMTFSHCSGPLMNCKLFRPFFSSCLRNSSNESRTVSLLCCIRTKIKKRPIAQEPRTVYTTRALSNLPKFKGGPNTIVFGSVNTQMEKAQSSCTFGSVPTFGHHACILIEKERKKDKHMTKANLI